MNGKQLIRKFTIGLFALTLGCLLLAALAVRIGVLDHFLRSEITRLASQRYGLRVDIGTLKAHVVPPRLDLRSVEMRSANAPAGSPPLLQTQQLFLAVEFLPLLHGKVKLSRLLLDRPVVHLRIDANGRGNFDLSPRSGPAPGTTNDGAIFDLAVEDCAIRSGEIYYNNAQIPLSADIRDLAFVARYSHLHGDYTGSFSYDRGRLSTPGLAPIAHAVQMDFAATPSVLSVSRLHVSSGASEINMKGRLTNYATPLIEGTYDAAIATNELGAILRHASIPVGKVILTGGFSYDAGAKKSLVTVLHLAGHLRGDALSVYGARQTLSISGLSGDYDLTDGHLRIQRLAGKVLGGDLSANVDVTAIGAPAPTVHVDGALRGISLPAVANAFAPPNVRTIPLLGVADLGVKASWSAPFGLWDDNVVAHARLSVSSPEGQIADSRAVPVSGLVLIDYDARQNKISFGRSYLQTRATKLSVTGALDPHTGKDSALEMNVSTEDLREINSLFETIETATNPGAAPLRIPFLSGSAAFSGSATGTLRAPRIQGVLTAEGLSIAGSRWRSLRADFAASPSQIRVLNASLSGNLRERIAFSGEAGLQGWSLGSNGVISLQATASGIAASDLDAIAQVHYPITGIVSANVSIRGTLGTPEGNATVTLANGTAWNAPFSKVDLAGDFHLGSIHSTANLQMAFGAISADATYTLASQTYSLRASGSALKLDKIDALQGNNVRGSADFTATGSGTLADPVLQANLAVPQLRAQGQTVSNVAVQISVAHRRASVSLHSIVNQGSAEGTADVDMDGNHYATASLDIRGLPVAAVAADFVPAQSAKLGGQAEIHATIRGPLAAPAAIQAHIQIRALNVTFGSAQLALTRPLEADYANNTLTISKSQIQGTGTNLTFGGTIPFRGSTPFSVVADGTADLAVLHQFLPDVTSQGELDVHIASQGDARQPSIRGQIEVKNAVFSSDSLPASIENLDGEIGLSGNRAVINKLAGTVGGGQFSATGSFDLGSGNHFALGLNAQSVRIRFPQGLRSVLNAQLTAEGDPSNSSLAGRVTVDSLSFTQSFDLSNFLSSLSDDSSVAPPSSFEQGMKLHVALLSAQALSLASSRLSIGGSANLNVIGTLSQPILLGRLGLTSGEIFYLGKRFELENGTVEFANPARTDPVLNMYITTNVQQYKITAKLAGSIDRLRTNYTSEPSMSQADIIHLLAFGNTNAQAASAAPTTATQNAEAVLAEGVSSPLTGKLQSITGLSQLSIDPLATNAYGDPGAQVAIQQRVTGSILFTFSTNVTTTQNQAASLQYNVNKRLSVTILRDQNGGYGLDIRIHKVF